MTKLQKLMYGRYGIDELHGFIFKLYICLIIIGLFLDNEIFIFIELLLLFIMVYRFLSKKCYQRRKENKIYLELKKELEKPFKNIKRNIKDKDYIYKRCRKCKKTLKLPLPYERGIKHTKCPNCKTRITFITLKRKKIEIIKK